jgi:predicted SprT family Zn-dependent metalloprotease
MFFENTIRHEIAHAIEFEVRGTSDHGNLWKLIARQVLCNAERCYKINEVSITSPTKYTLICDNCGVERPSHKKKKRKSACGKCCNTYNGGRFTEKFLLRQVQNY